MNELPVNGDPGRGAPAGGDAVTTGAVTTGAVTTGAVTTGAVTIDCDHCLVRGPSACGDCVVSVLLGGPPQGVRLDEDEQSALDALASSGLVPPLRLVTAVDGPGHTAESA